MRRKTQRHLVVSGRIFVRPVQARPRTQASGRRATGGTDPQGDSEQTPTEPDGKGDSRAAREECFRNLTRYALQAKYAYCYSLQSTALQDKNFRARREQRNAGYNFVFQRFAGVAQLVEQRTRNA